MAWMTYGRMTSQTECRPRRPCHGESAKKRRQEEKESKESKSTILQLQQLSQSLPTAGSNKSHLHAQLL